MKDFRGKVVYVVGGSSGIGLAAARRFSAAGAHVAIFARNQERLAAAMESIRAARRERDQRCACFCLDATSPTQTAVVMGQACESIGPPDVLLNSAGQATPHRFEETPFEQLEATIGVNLYATWNAVAALLPALKERRGYIINVSSIAGFLGVFGYTDYSASKFAVMGFSEALRQELRPAGVSVSVLCPPDSRTPGFEEELKTRPPETSAIAEGARFSG